MIVIGSKALTFRLEQTEEVVERWYKTDYDVLMSIDEFKSWCSRYKEEIIKLYPTQENKYKAILSKYGRKKQYEIEIGYEGTSAEFLLKHEQNVTDCAVFGYFGELFNALSLQYQFLTKRSHLIYPVHFEKNMNDYHLIKSLIGDFKRDELMQEYYKLRAAEAKERYSRFKTPKLNVTNEDFFSSKLAVENYFVHDDIHEVMKHHDVPVYEMMKRDFGLAKCEKDMFFALPYDYQIQAVQEEAYTIALERYIVPQAGEDWQNYLNCYKKALMRICTTLCSGWFRSFAIENYNVIVERYNPDFVKRFKAAFDTGEIKALEDKVVPEMIA
jgi:hypothetical protein